MRFSLKWVLAGMAYVAVAAAAFQQQTWAFADALWATSLLAVVFAALLACFARGRRQIAAAGFVISSACYLVCLHSSNAVPTGRLLAAAGVTGNAAPAMAYSPPPGMVRTRRPVAVMVDTPTGPVQQTTYVYETRTVATPTPSPALASTYPQARFTSAPISMSYDGINYLSRAGNAVGMMAFGLLGCVVGVMAYKAARRDAVSL